MSATPDRLRQTFLEEATEHLGEIEQGLLQLESGPHDPDLLNCLFRAAHSIKGGSGLFELTRLTRLTHALEHVLGRMREGHLIADGVVVDLLLRAGDALKGMLDAAQRGGEDMVDLDPLLADLANRVGAPPAIASSAVAPAVTTPTGRADYRVRFSPSPDLLREGSDPLILLRNLKKRCHDWSARVDLARLPLLDDLDPECCYLVWDLTFTSESPREDLEGVFSFLDAHSEITFEVIGKEGEQVCRLDALTTLLSEQVHLLETVRASWTALVSAAEQRSLIEARPS